ncbi:ABC transporter permease subunit [Actinoalloteichus hymeniacidonis]|uniref:ABC-2 family transporter protein n=1 Tax=Actinoalloteichus hymeniacidonis TaxID=340345 RepID=A0AAC9HU09_9PSEU|nr:ABC transporter permease subunit [Actinoalloteichus hymeniacidonis]AOS65380.1 ABC-2 family transporter protein [Actinoalloteichus hymeniacidonis]MBB5906534.1 ABC-2 type transport system permease protein [Actinoalloteichus hymeniacidonis]
MNRLIKSEFRKIFSTNLWWALLIPAGLFCFLLALLGGTVGNMFGTAVNTEIPESEMESIGSFTSLLTTLTFAAGLVAAGIFAGIFGALGMAGEARHKTITTTFLVSDSRSSVLGAKVVSYAAIGALYGLVSVILGSLGAGIGASFTSFPDIGSWLLLSLVAVVVMSLWTILGLGLGALISNQAGVVLTLVLLVLIGEGLIAQLFAEMGVENAADYLPGGSASAALLGLAVTLGLQPFLDSVGVTIDQLSAEAPEMSMFTDMSDQWLISALVFLLWTAIFVAAGWLANNKRDIT